MTEVFIWGRDDELNLLKALQLKSTSSLVVLKGRRRIGKSTLIQEFAKLNATYYFEFLGLAPRPKQTNTDQLNQFTFQFNNYFKKELGTFSDWNMAFSELAKAVSKLKNVVVLLDELSWMGAHGPDFSGKLKIS